MQEEIMHYLASLLTKEQPGIYADVKKIKERY
jgi:hypothetical protein